MDRTKVRKLSLHDPEQDLAYMEGTPEERILAVWELTKEAYSLSPEHDVERRLQNTIVTVRRRTSSTADFL
ncbi:MAG TPA: hypothetical protein PKO06_16510 [Candidatus Ozemobacteraceae bacterium]|nr:hypothetical protein [Candidatus Ozemobacteraceae bacterium]